MVFEVLEDILELADAPGPCDAVRVELGLRIPDDPLLLLRLLLLLPRLGGISGRIRVILRGPIAFLPVVLGLGGVPRGGRV